MPIGAGTAAGAASGASTGMMFGPWGALIGGVAGGILGSLGPGEPTARPFQMIRAGNAERLVNKADSEAWKSLVAKYTGQPVQVLNSSSMRPTAYGSQDAMDAAGGSGVYARGMNANQDTAAKGVNAETGLAMQDYALRGKLQSGINRRGVQQAIAQMQMANKIHNSQIANEWNAQQNALWAQAGKSAMGMAGAFAGGGASAPVAGSTNTSSMAGFNSAGAVTPSASPYQWSFQPGGVASSQQSAFGQSPFAFAYPR